MPARRPTNHKHPKLASISISNFGPISTGSINLKPLTIFMGPNNSGKSYAATLIHAILSAHAVPKNGSYQYSAPRRLLARRAFDKDANAGKLASAGDGFTIPPAQAQRLVSSALASLLKTSIESNFGSPTRDLVRSKQKTSKITVTGPVTQKIELGDGVKVSTKFNDSLAHKIKFVPGEPGMIRAEVKGNTRILSVDKRLKPSLQSDMSRIVIDFLLDSARLRPEVSYYLPSERSGILRGHRAIAAGFIRRAPYAGLERFEMPPLTKVASDLLSDLFYIRRRPGSFAELSEGLERDILGGNIGLHRLDRHSVPDIVCQSPNETVPLHRSSSTVSEMAPLSLYLKHLLRKDDLLIIEEPEAHLHASNQTMFAEYVVKMIRQGLNLLITTHSSLLMEALNNHLLASGLGPDGMADVGIGRDDYLLQDEISPYLFVKDGQGGHAITPVEIDEDGISLQEFIKITSSFYERGLRIDKWREEHGS